jgi:hypothetical protein
MEKYLQLIAWFTCSDNSIQFRVRLSLAGSITQNAQDGQISYFPSTMKQLLFIHLFNVVNQPVEHEPGEPPRFTAVSCAFGDNLLGLSSRHTRVHLRQQYCAAQLMPFLKQTI